MIKYIIALASLLLILTSGCRTGVILRETPLGISETRRMIVSVIGEPRNVSRDGRELSSKYYDKRGNVLENPATARQRLYTLVSVLGDRRPYDIQVEVVVEEKDGPGSYSVVDRDDGRAQPIAQKIKEALHQSLENRNVIDDFRSF